MDRPTYIDHDVNLDYYYRGLAFIKEMYCKGSAISNYVDSLDSSKPRSAFGSASPRVRLEVNNVKNNS